MTKRDIFRIIIKIIGLYFVLQIPMQLFNLAHLIMSFKYAFSDSNLYYDDLISFLMDILMVIVVVAVVGFFFCYLIFKGDKIIDLFKLDKNFDTDKSMPGNIKAKELLTVGIVLVAGITFIDNISPTLSSIFYIFKESVANSYNYTGYILNNDNYFYLSQNIVSIFVSLLLIFNASKVADYLLTNNLNIEKPE